MALSHKSSLAVFDFDGTIADSADCAICATQKAFKEMGLPEPIDALVETMMGCPIEESFARMGAESLTASEYANLLQSFRGRYRELEVSRIKLFPGIKALLEGLTHRRVPIVILSSKRSDVLLRNCQMLRIDSFIHSFVGSDQVSKYKPDPEGLRLVCSRFVFEPASVFMIGDAPVDIEMAKRAGAKSCAAFWGTRQRALLSAARPEYSLETPLELLEHVSV